MKTYIPKESDFARQTYLMNASGKTLGRLATKVASLIVTTRRLENVEINLRYCDSDTGSCLFFGPTNSSIIPIIEKIP